MKYKIRGYQHPTLPTAWWGRRQIQIPWNERLIFGMCRIVGKDMNWRKN